MRLKQHLIYIAKNYKNKPQYITAMDKKAKNKLSKVLYVIAILACLTGLGFFIATAAGASSVFVNTGIWLIVGGVVVAIAARAFYSKKLVD